jgi:transposase
VSNVGSDRSQLANTAKAAKEAIGTETLEAIADRGYFNGDEIKTCDDAGITVTLPKPMTSWAKANGRFGKEDFVYLAAENVYRCPAGEKLTYRFTSEEHGLKLHRYWTNACRTCSLKSRCTPGPQHPITRWEYEDVLEAVQKWLAENPQAMRTRRETAEHPFGTMKMRMGATHFLMKTLPKVATEMALCVLTYNLTRVLNIVGVPALLEAIKG